jgi:hypothetical protein
MRVFVAGASGAIGEPLIAELLKQGHSVVGMTTSEARAKFLEGQGASAAILDVFDAKAIETVLRQSAAEVVIDELTSLPKEQSEMPKYAAGDRKLRIEGGGNLFRAAIATGVRRYLQQSSGFFLKSAEGNLADESSPLDVNASGPDRLAQVADQSFDVLGSSRQVELLLDELQSTQAQTAKADVTLQLCKQCLDLFPLSLCVFELRCRPEIARSLPSSFVHVDSKVAKRSGRALRSLLARTALLARSDIAESPIALVTTTVVQLLACWADVAVAVR